MKTSKLFLCLAIGSSLLLLNGCKKDDDSTYQPKGTYGNANLTSSSTVTLNNWSSDFNDGINYEYSSVINWASITQAVKDNGIVMAYVDDGAGGWLALPYTDAGDSYYSYSFNFSFKVGSISIIANGFDDLGAPATTDFNGTIIRIVAISPVTRAANPNLDYKNFNAVKVALHLKD